MPPSALVDGSVEDQVNSSLNAKSKASGLAGIPTENIDIPKVLVHGNRQGTLPVPRIPKYANVDEERQANLERMACALRVLSRKGFQQAAAGHMSYRDPANPHLMWLNPVFRTISTIQASDFVCVDEDGYVTEHGNQAVVNSAGVFIHLGVHKARPDVKSAVHLHSENGVTWSCFGKPLDMLNQDACAFVDNQAIVKFGGIVTAHEEGSRIAQHLGDDKTCCILENHGLLTVGETPDEAAYRFILMDKLCGEQLKAEAAEHEGCRKKHVSVEDARKNAQISNNSEFMYLNFQVEREELLAIEAK